MITLTFFLANALRPVRREFPDDCTITIGRAVEGPDLVVLGAAPAFEVRARSPHLSDDHAVIVCRSGAVTLEDRGSRNGTFVRLDPARPHPLDARPVRLGHDLVVVRDDPSRPLPEYLGHLAPEAFAAWLRAHLGDRLSVELTPDPTATSLALVGTALHLAVRPVGEARTLDADASWWLRAVVNTWNASARPLTDARPWRFEARSASRRRALDLARRVAGTALPVLLVGPSGAGRTVLAQDLHDHGTAPDSPFVTARCATLTPATLAGHLDLAGDGTLFLDELADLSAATQSELLSRLSAGPRAHHPPAARVLAATTSDLASAAWSERVQRDLRDRLALLVIDVHADHADAAPPSADVPAPVKNIAPPATLGRLFADMVFLLAARDASGCAPLSRRVHMTYQGADARLGALDVTVGDRAACDAKIAALQRELRAHVARAPAVMDALRGVLDG
ncbi:MAG: sigma 54-interacting transcriptional regulator [Deltaproteobacteria bacterium]|nr:sigma 54-interacting transcriptional regulator [Myxococcales bacterium]MDP3216190.1 sigma 54-interacting transcriptional regulator [Deltaproteobacteria bacterium]